MTEYQIQANTRRCSVTGRELQPGEKYYSVLIDEAGKLIRKDYGADAWQGPPNGLFSFWKGTVPPPEENKRPRIDDDMLMDCFQRLEGQTEPNRLNFRFVVALLLMRRKRLKFEEVRTQGEQEILSLRCAKTKVLYAVMNPRLSKAEMETVQEEVFKVLGWE
ncbi:MAG TPA: hypothetical protein VGY77_01105 [Gemmataceae bacterium]|jgi:hypothetical protein|nr:hypothetical protein [Gemmataceae bacterium]